MTLCFSPEQGWEIPQMYYHHLNLPRMLFSPSEFYALPHLCLLRCLQFYSLLHLIQLCTNIVYSYQHSLLWIVNIFFPYL